LIFVQERFSKLHFFVSYQEIALIGQDYFYIFGSRFCFVMALKFAAHFLTPSQNQKTLSLRVEKKRRSNLKKSLIHLNKYSGILNL